MNQLLLLIAFVPVITGVQIFLENNSPGPINKEVELGKPLQLICRYQSSTGVTDKTSTLWKHSLTRDTSNFDLIYYDNEIIDKHKSTYSVTPPLTLEIAAATMKTSGYFICSVTIPSDSNPLADGRYNVTVIVPPSTPICSYTSDHALTLGFGAEFRCKSSEGIPYPTYAWYKNGNKLPLNGGSSSVYANTSYSYSESTGTLYFSKATKADAGTYHCEASNKLGSKVCTSATITIKEQDIGMIVGIVFGCVFGILLIGILAWWVWKRGYCDGFTDKDDYDEADQDYANDIMLDGNGPVVNKPPSEYNGSVGRQEASMMI